MHVCRFIIFFFLLTVSACDTQGRYTQEEKEYIASNEITWAAESSLYPIIFLDNKGTIDGITKDYLELISKKSGLRFKLVSVVQSKQEVVELLRNEKIDLATTLKPSPERVFATFSRPYIDSDMVMLKRISVPKTVGISRGYAVGIFLRNTRQDLQISEFETDEIGFRALMNDEIDSVVMNEISAKALLRKYNKKYDGSEISYDYLASFAVRKDNTILLHILDKAITDITREEQLEILRKWL